MIYAHDPHYHQTQKVPEQRNVRNTLNLCKLPSFSVTSASMAMTSFLCFPFSFLRCRSISTKVVYCRMRDFSFTCRTVIFLLFSESIFFISFESIWRALSKFWREPQRHYWVNGAVLMCPCGQNGARSCTYVILFYFHSILLSLIFQFSLLLSYHLRVCFPNILFTVTNTIMMKKRIKCWTTRGIHLGYESFKVSQNERHTVKSEQLAQCRTPTECWNLTKLLSVPGKESYDH